MKAGPARFICLSGVGLAALLPVLVIRTLAVGLGLSAVFLVIGLAASEYGFRFLIPYRINKVTFRE